MKKTLIILNAHAQTIMSMKPCIKKYIYFGHQTKSRVLNVLIFDLFQILFMLFPLYIFPPLISPSSLPITGFLKPQCSLTPPMQRGRSGEACSCFSGVCPLHQRRLSSGNTHCTVHTVGSLCYL